MVYWLSVALSTERRSLQFGGTQTSYQELKVVRYQLPTPPSFKFGGVLLLAQIEANLFGFNFQLLPAANLWKATVCLMKNTSPKNILNYDEMQFKIIITISN